jgi:hypothetical protein
VIFFKLKILIFIFLLGSCANAQKHYNFPKTISSAVDSLLLKINTQDKFLLKNIKPEKLISFHFSLGKWIRNNYGLWGLNEPLLKECAKVSSVDTIHPDEASGIIIDSLWAALQRINLNLSIPEPIIIRSDMFKKDELEELKKIIPYPELAWKSGTNSKFQLLIETDYNNEINSMKFSPIKIDNGFSYQTKLSIKKNWDKIVNILSLQPNQKIKLEFEFNSFGKKYQEYLK